MSKRRHVTPKDIGTLAEDAHALMTATADVAGEKVADARKRLADSLESFKDIAENVREQAVDFSKATDQAVHEHPYRAIGIAFGVGAFLGHLVSRGCARNGDR
jgi:ElaB/YqjD/DUF883 family membrane-anchored ribosome-binding protein